MNHFFHKVFGIKSSSVDDKVKGKKQRSVQLKPTLPAKRTPEADPDIEIKKIECESCLEPHNNLFVFPCQHSFCTGCVRGLFQTALNDKEFMPVRCCGKRVDQRLRRDVFQLDELQAFEKLLEESDASQKLYCPGRGCSIFYNLDKVQTNADGAFSCSACKTPICSKCRTSHPQYTCVQYNALPLHERSPDDLEFFEVAKLKQYSRCTRCGRFTELVALNCGRVYCKCGSSYSYYQHRYTGPTNGIGGSGLTSNILSVPTAPVETAVPSAYELEEAPCAHEWRGCNKVLDRPRLCHVCRPSKRCFQSSCTLCRLRVCALCKSKLD